MHTLHLDVNLETLQDNLEKIKAHLNNEETKIIAVVKSNAYGHGLIEIAKALMDQVDYLGVGLLEEGIALREAGIITPILIMGPTYDYEKVMMYQLTLTIVSIEHYKSFLDWVMCEGCPLSFHLKVDTGMHRFGIRLEEIDTFIALYDKEQTPMEGVYSHLGTTYKSNAKNVKKQKEVFDQFVKQLINYGMEGIFHLANSENAIDDQSTHYNMVRIGNALYGPCNSKNQIGLKKIATMKSPVVAVREVKKGERVGYGSSYRAKKDMKIAVIPIGFYEGYSLYKKPLGINLVSLLVFYMKEIFRYLFRDSSNIYWRGSAVPVVGRVNMQYTIIGLPKEADILVGDEIEIKTSPIFIKENIKRTYNGGQ